MDPPITPLYKNPAEKGERVSAFASVHLRESSFPSPPGPSFPPFDQTHLICSDIRSLGVVVDDLTDVLHVEELCCDEGEREEQKKEEERGEEVVGGQLRLLGRASPLSKEIKFKERGVKLTEGQVRVELRFRWRKD